MALKRKYTSRWTIIGILSCSWQLRVLGIVVTVCSHHATGYFLLLLLSSKGNDSIMFGTTINMTVTCCWF